MNKTEKGLNLLAIIFSVWFVLTSWMWSSYAALFISYPFGIVSLLMLVFSPYSWGKKLIKILLITGLALSMAALLLYR
ncbi:hypothetical protein EZ456_04305 [Pedobacter psychrodurus]|uniref:Uncharacterized protein n=1 Tax=Pedobacter psychrodurus TaxID=2530456 RepID=A0A4V2MR97_9SPHI|nr:hypothetical protein [Pedobacter psychrodurus]TCD28617.1 hypothetical protein EZ456_04305 [Pedobacter psychrodurus]